ncbi:MAG: hypothetical protein PHP86_01875 [Nevskiales bacterium]|nr:hypothetical protein [Nevskiales bacterium]
MSSLGIRMMRSTLAGLLAWALCSGTAAAAPGDPLTPVFRLDDGIVISSDFGLARDASGNLLAIWKSPGTIFGRWLTADGAPLGPVMTLTPPDSGLIRPLSHQAVAIAPDRSFVIAYGRSVYGGREGVFAQRYDADGTPLGGEIRVSVPMLGEHIRDLAITVAGLIDRVAMDPVVGMDAEGNFCIAWLQAVEINGDPKLRTYGDLTGTRINLQRFRADGRRLGLITPLATAYDPILVTPRFALLLIASTGIVANPRIAVQDDGRFAVAWNRFRRESNILIPSAGYVTDIEYRTYDARGAGQIDVQPVISGESLGELQDMAAAGPDHYLLAWNGIGLTHAQRWNADGSPGGSDYAFAFADREPPARDVYASVAGAGDGSAVLTWQTYTAGQVDVMATLFDAGGNAYGAPFQVNSASPNHEQKPLATAGPDGRFTIGWDFIDVLDSRGGEFQARGIEGFTAP